MAKSDLTRTPAIRWVYLVGGYYDLMVAGLPEA